MHSSHIPGMIKGGLALIKGAGSAVPCFAMYPEEGGVLMSEMAVVISS